MGRIAGCLCAVKVCSKCGEEKGEDAFCKGRMQCKACKSEYNKAYHAANPEKVKALDAAWRAANPEKLKERNAKYRAAHRERERLRNAAWRAANPEKARRRGAA